MSRALILGAVFVDVVVNVPTLPTSGADVTGEAVASHVGGCAYNVYGAVRAAGQIAELFVPVGIGEQAATVRADFERNGIPVTLPVETGDNGWDLALVEPDGERSFLTIDGVEQCWQPAWFDRLDLTSYDYFYISGYELENPISAQVILQALAQRHSQAYVVFDPSPRVTHLPADCRDAILSDRVMVHCNEAELDELVPGGDNLEDKLHRLFTLTHSPVIVTLGQRGTVYYNGQTSQTLPGATVPVTNTIGAGDTHCGGLLAGLMAGMDLKTAVRQANELAAQVIQQVNGCLPLK
ncbi:ribokinase [Lactiplantibacillus garii]|uniref:Ribokinase n=1 Tax=Lactiplantibacillus garii TaxID=2306423 RepID=A0A3R8J6P2_9LACO|nr:PfkB family carbohydrate kinase [Lactiplantibacillus garii]RRK10322.1 ribokinase [Lactiplantibacillus garii]